MDSPHKHPRILVVEPSPALRKIIEITFNRAGGQTILYSEPLEVVKAMDKKQLSMPDIAFIDLTPNKKSYHLIRMLRSEWKGLAVVAFSRKDSPISRLRARCAGVIVYLPKPFTTEQLIASAMIHAQH